MYKNTYWTGMAFILRGWQHHTKERPETFEVIIPNGSESQLSFTWVNFEFGRHFRLEETVVYVSRNGEHYRNSAHGQVSSCLLVPFQQVLIISITWWRRQMETFSALLVICAGSRWIPRTKPVTRSFDIFFDLRRIKWLNKQPWGWWFETL